MTPEALLQHCDEATLWPEGCGLEVPVAYQRALAVRHLRMARGERRFKVIDASLPADEVFELARKAVDRAV